MVQRETGLGLLYVFFSCFIILLLTLYFRYHDVHTTPHHTTPHTRNTHTHNILITYTSGSTGAPKCVCITHANLIASVGAVHVLLGHHLTYEDSFLAYLPLAHVLEYIVELVMIFIGMPCGYGPVKTITDASVWNCKGDISTFRPSIMFGVPAVWETIRKGVVAKVNSGSAITKAIFNGAMYVKNTS
jgi:long-chain acyl-CoA synthetase